MAGAASHVAPHAERLEGPRYILSTFPLLTPEGLCPRGQAAAQRGAAAGKQAWASCTWPGRAPGTRVETPGVGAGGVATPAGLRRRGWAWWGVVGRRLGPWPWPLRFSVLVKEQKAREVPTPEGGPQRQH